MHSVKITAKSIKKWRCISVKKIKKCKTGKMSFTFKYSTNTGPV